MSNGPLHEKAQLDVVIRNTCANVAIILTRVHNLQVELNELREEHKKLRAVVCTLLSDPQAREDALAVLKDFRFNKNNPK